MEVGMEYFHPDVLIVGLIELLLGLVVGAVIGGVIGLISGEVNQRRHTRNDNTTDKLALLSTTDNCALPAHLDSGA